MTFKLYSPARSLGIVPMPPVCRSECGRVLSGPQVARTGTAKLRVRRDVADTLAAVVGVGLRKMPLLLALLAFALVAFAGCSTAAPIEDDPLVADVDPFPADIVYPDSAEACFRIADELSDAFTTNPPTTAESLADVSDRIARIAAYRYRGLRLDDTAFDQHQRFQGDLELATVASRDPIWLQHGVAFYEARVNRGPDATVEVDVDDYFLLARMYCVTQVPELRERARDILLSNTSNSPDHYWSNLWLGLMQLDDARGARSGGLIDAAREKSSMAVPFLFTASVNTVAGQSPTFAMTLLGEAYLGANRAEDAVGVFSLILLADPVPPVSSYEGLARAFVQLARFDRALDTLIIQLPPEKGADNGNRFVRTLAWIYERQAAYRLALFEQSQNPIDWAAHETAMHYAIANYDLYLNLYPDDRATRQTRDDLAASLRQD